MQFVNNRVSETLAKIFSEDIQYQRGNYYFFLAKVDPWNGSETFDPIVDDRSINEKEARDSMVFAKKIRSSDVSLATRRINWESGVTYSKWDHTKIMKGLDFYVLTDEMNVYKCLDNYGNSPSTVKPTGKNINSVRLPDGYIWKYMYSIPRSKQRRFLGQDVMPIQRSLGDSFYEKGSISSVTILNGGSGYADTALTTLTISGPTVGNGAVLDLIVTAGVVTAVNVINGGSGYTHGARVKINTTSGTGAIVDLTIANGVITSATVINGGTNYLVSDTAIAEVGGAKAYVKLDFYTGSIKEVVISDPGIGYAVAPSVIVSSIGSIGTGLLPGNSSAVCEAFIQNGSVNFIRIVDPGIGYPLDTSTIIDVKGNGTGAVLRPIVIDGKIVDVVVENQGSGYNEVVLTAIGTGSGAQLTAILNTESVDNDEQKIVENLAEFGSIFSIEVTNGGTGYSPNTFANITGDGTGATCTVVRNSWGSISRIEVNNFGSGYSYGSISIVDPDALGSGAQAYIILPPNNGHGYDAVKELYSDTVVLNSVLRNDLVSDNIPQDYRIFGIIRNPLDIISGRAFRLQEELMAYKVRMLNADGLSIDETLTFQDRYKFTVIHISGNDVYLLPRFNKGPIPIGRIESDSSVEYLISDVINLPAMDKYTGDVISITRTNPFSFNDAQGVVIKTTIEF